MKVLVARSKSSLWLHFAFGLALILNFAFWLHARTILPQWDNVPPPPKSHSAEMISLGDPGIAYRLFGYFLQNVGNTGGQFQSLLNYDYAALEKWFMVTNDLDPSSNLVPFLAAYYFGVLYDQPEKMRHVARYLAEAGMEPYPEKWRWLAHAVFMARHRVKDLPLALEYANTLANLPGDVAVWGRQMPAFIQESMDNKRASYEIMRKILITEGEKLHPNEVNYMIEFICTRSLTPAEAAKDPICQNP